MKPEFTQKEKEIMKGKVAPLARKFGCSHTYVKMILSGSRELNTKLSLDIYNGIKETVKLFTPVSQ
tara:strand:+ start:291 stop:488 length:198 start_codon:yes stop_codon:yes gene_type:complete